MTTRRYDAILRAVRGALWLIDPAKGQEILALLELRAAGGHVDPEIREAALASASGSRPRISRSVAILPLTGVISNRMNMMSEFSGGTSTEEFGRMFDAAVLDSEVGVIVLDIESPGGASYGVPELAAKIFAARGTKPCVAVANAYACSAAYWIACAADEVVCTPSGMVGSVGAVLTHEDFSKANEEDGRAVTYVTYGRYKVEGNPDQPLSDEARQEWQRQIDTLGESFVKAVAKYRGTTPAKVREDYGQGRCYFAQEALQRGMIDRIESLPDTIARLSGTKPGGRSGAARASAAKAKLDLLRLNG